MRIRTIAVALALLLTAAGAHAQDSTLDRVQNLINTGRLTDARNTLAQWERANGDPTSDATPADRARALYLTGILSTDPALAEDAFLNVVLSYPSSQVAPDALLRLGQALYTAGDNDRAVSYLSRLQSDYPQSTARETGVLWLARAQLAGGAASDACGTARDNLAGTSNPNLRLLIEIERDRACQASGGIATRGAALNTGAAFPSAAPNAARAPSAADQPASSTDAARQPPAGEDRRASTDVRSTPAASGEAPRAGTPAAADARSTAQRPGDGRAADTAPRGTSQPATPAPKLPDLGIAVDDNVREPEPEQRPNAAVPRPAAPGQLPPTNPARSSGDDAARSAERTGNDARAAAGDGAPRAPAASDNTSRAAAADAADTGRAAADTNTGEFAIQTAAFGSRQAADRIAAELKAKGFDARIVTVPGSPLYRVRYGIFHDRRAAAAAALHVRDAGFATLIVNDARLERQQ